MSTALKNYIKEVTDWPSPGVSFKDITPLLANPAIFHEAIHLLTEQVKLYNPSVIAVPEARGFLFGAPVALALNLPLVLIRKAGKLPRKTIKQSFQLEYGQTELFLHEDALAKGQRVVILDDVLATGGTAVAMAKLVELLHAEVVGFCFLINLTYLPGESTLKDARYDVKSVVNY